MRTTLDIADDMLQAAKERAMRERKTIGEMIWGSCVKPPAARGRTLAYGDALNAKYPVANLYVRYRTDE
jgi:hypothetical protein